MSHLPILTIAAEVFETTPENIRGRSLRPPDVDARSAVAWILRQQGTEFRVIAEILGLAISSAHQTEIRAACKLRAERKGPFIRKMATAAKRWLELQPSSV